MSSRQKRARQNKARKARKKRAKSLPADETAKVEVKTSERAKAEDEKDEKELLPQPIAGLDTETKFVQPNPRLEVWARSDALDSKMHNAMVQELNKLAQLHQDFFVDGYENILDPNLYMQPLSDKLKPKFPDDYRWCASDVQLTPVNDIKNKDTRNIHLVSPIHDLVPDKWTGIHCGVEEMLKAAWPVLKQLHYYHLPRDMTPRAQLENPKDYPQFHDGEEIYDPDGDYEMCEEEYMDIFLGEVRKRYGEKPARLVFGPRRHQLQCVVKAQRVMVNERGYKGLWHDEGLPERERIIAGVVYYYKVPSQHELTGGALQFASKLDMCVTFGHTKDVQSGWQHRAQCTVPIQERTLLVFNNSQTVHRVLEMLKTDRTGPGHKTREFIALFIVDPHHPLPSTAPLFYARQGLVQMHHTMASFDPLLEIVLQYLGGYMTQSERRDLRVAVFREQMTPRKLGKFIMYTTGNGDCKTVCWANPDFIRGATKVLKGSDTDSGCDAT